MREETLKRAPSQARIGEVHSENEYNVPSREGKKSEETTPHHQIHFRSTGMDTYQHN